MFGKIIVCIILVIVVIIVSYTIDSNLDSKFMERLATSIDDINRVWNAQCPTFRSVTKTERTIRVSISNEEEKQQYQEWLSTLPISFPHQFFDKEHAIRECYGDNMIGMLRKRENIIGGLFLMSEDDKYSGNFMFWENEFEFNYSENGIYKITREMKYLGCPLPELHILYVSFHGYYNYDYTTNARVKFENPIEPEYFERIKEAVKNVNRWEAYGTNGEKFRVGKNAAAVSGEQDFVHISFWKDDEGNQFADFSWGQI